MEFQHYLGRTLDAGLIMLNGSIEQVYETQPLQQAFEAFIRTQTQPLQQALEGLKRAQMQPLH